jgi:predicted lipoprotein with Yx(FWY)xxD motif
MKPASHRRLLGRVPVALGVGLTLATLAPAQAADKAGLMTESYAQVPMPPGFKVVPTELEGPVFADANGHTLYKWPLVSLRNGYAGDPKDKSACTDIVSTKTGGYMSPYPPDLVLPELDKRKSCLAEWPAVLAGPDAKPIGRFTLITRPDGAKQWAYDNHALYISRLDQQPGDTIGGTTILRSGGDTPAERAPVGPPPDVPPGFVVDSTVRGRMLLNDKRRSVYVWDNDGNEKSNCHDDCALTWQAVIAPESARPHGEWSIADNGGVRQWAFRHKPLYTNTQDEHQASLDGAENPGWHNVYTQLTPAWPKSFTSQVTTNGDVLADAKGKTIYFYTCGDDSADQLSCDLPDSPKAYFQAICGGFDAERCARLWHYVEAEPGAKSDSRAWSVLVLDAKTGSYAQPGQPGAITVWAYRGRPLFTYAGDTQPGDYAGHRLGEWQGRRNGFRAFWIHSEIYGRG